MKIPFILLSETDGSPLTGKSADIDIRISKDCGEFSMSANTAEEFSPGYYSIELTEDELTVEQFAIVEIACPGAQLIVKQWMPETGSSDNAQAIAKTVWNYKLRQLTSDASDIIEPNTTLSVTSAVKLTIEPNKP